MAAVDWQLCCRSGGLFDVAYFLVYSLDVATRRQHEQELLRRYYEVLREGGVTGYDFAHCRDDYRWAVLYCFHYVVMVAVADPGNAQGEALFATMQERGLAANLDWDTGALLTA